MVETSTLVGMERGEHNSPHRSGKKPQSLENIFCQFLQSQRMSAFITGKKCPDEESGSQNVPHI